MPSPALRPHLRALVPEVAPLLLRSASGDAAEKSAAIKVLLLACTLTPPDGMLTCLSVTLPLLVGCMHLGADGKPSQSTKELSMLAHASFTALAKRSPNEFRAAVSWFTSETRARMETALRESAATTTITPGHVANTPPAAPKIALKMDFSGFGTK